MDITRRWLTVLAAVVATSACSSSTTTPAPTTPAVFMANGEGNAAVSISDAVLQVQVTAAFTGPSASLVMWVGPVTCPAITSSGCRMIVNQQLGTSTNLLTYSAVLPTGNGGSSATDTLTVQSSGAVNWSVVQVQ
jgi:hypothetical protein